MSDSSQAMKSTSLKSTQGWLTFRTDAWWVEPLLTLIILGSFGMYATWAALQGVNYQWGPYLSPFYSPNLVEWFPQWFGSWPFSPAVLILPFPLVFRATCYYYRKAYYRSFFTSPPACAVDITGQAPKSPLAFLLGQGKGYTGETAFPLILQNAHRYAFYFAALFIFILGYDAIKAFVWTDGFHVGVGSLVLTINVALLGLYTFSCHSWRHLLGGCIDCFSCDKMTQVRHKAWERQSLLNEKHMQFAWASLLWVAFSDIYVRLVSSGVWTDYRLF